MSLFQNFMRVNSGHYHEGTHFPPNNQRKKMRMTLVFVLLGFFVCFSFLFVFFLFLFSFSYGLWTLLGGGFTIKYVYKLVVTFYFVLHQPRICVWKNFIVFSVSFSRVTLCSTSNRQSSKAPTFVKVPEQLKIIAYEVSSNRAVV